MLAWYARAPADGRDQQHLLPHAGHSRARELGARHARDFRFAIKASRRITHIAAPQGRKPRPIPWHYLYRTLAALGAKRGPVLFQLPPQMKKDLPRLCRLPAPAARKTIAPPSSSATTAGSTTRSTARCSAPARRCACPSARTMRRRRWWRRRPGATCGCASRPTRDDDLQQWAAELAQCAWSEIFVYFMHEPTAPAYAQTLMQMAA